MKIHFIGIGGIGMSALAQLALQTKHAVSGSDIKEDNLTHRLIKLGVRVNIGHNADNLEDNTEIVVYSSAISDDNVELLKARKLGIPIWARARMLKFLMQGKTTITVSGSHGKTTTTSLIANMLINAGLSPTVAAGGILMNIDENAVLGNGKYFVAEADESDGSFLYYEPTYSVITNIDYEHLDYYKDMDSIKKSFAKFMLNTKDEGCLFCCKDDSVLQSILSGYKKKAVSFGLDNTADIYAQNIKLSEFSSTFNCVYCGIDLGSFYLSAPGAHNISNALAVIGVGREIGIDKDIISSTLSNFKGTRRRFQVKFNRAGILVVDDYAHHPTEISAVLKVCQNIAHKKLIAIFQPHRYSRLYHLFDKFSACFDSVDKLFITDIYGAGEAPYPDVDAKLLCNAITKRNTNNTEFIEKPLINDALLALAEPGNLILFIGAGDITKVCDDFVNNLTHNVRVS